MDNFDTPIAFIVFNRPEETAKVFAQIKKIKPKKLLIVADGARKENKDDEINCKKTRELIENGVDWDCELLTNYADKNMGCGRRVSSGISWVFEQVSEAIILEDDCLPSLNFFPYARYLLDYYANDTRVMHINSSNNLQLFENTDKYFGKNDYLFSRIPAIWGWASWARAWQKYEFDFNKYTNSAAIDALYNIFEYKKSAEVWLNILKDLKNKKVNTWDYQWCFTCMLNNGLCITPKNNMIKNIGFNQNATHLSSESIFAKLELKTNNYPPKNPEFVLFNKEYDKKYHLNIFELGLKRRKYSRDFIERIKKFF